MERKNAFFAKTTAFRAKSGIKSIGGFGAAFGRRANAGAIFNRARLSTIIYAAVFCKFPCYKKLSRAYEFTAGFLRLANCLNNQLKRRMQSWQ